MVEFFELCHIIINLEQFLMELQNSIEDNLYGVIKYTKSVIQNINIAM